VLNKRLQGFTLIELLIGIAIMGILMALAMPSYQAWLQNAKIRNTAESILNGLQLARAEAVRNNAQVKFALGANSDWTVGCVTPTANCPAAIQSHTTAEGSSTSVTVTPDTAGGNAIVFNNFGTTLAPSAPAVAFGQLSVDIAPAGTYRQLNITIGTGGNARMCDPDPNISASDPRAC